MEACKQVNSNQRQKKQSGLFLMAADKYMPIPKEWFSLLEVNLSEMEAHKVSDELYQMGYTAEKLLPEKDESGKVNIKEIAVRIRKKYGVD